MILTTKEQEILIKHIGGGPIKTASILVFGNELGTAQGHTAQTFINEELTTIPLNSSFLQFISRMALACRFNDDTYYDKLNVYQNTLLYHYMQYELYKTDTAIINLRPLPRGTGKTWPYENINEKEYYKQYNYNQSRSSCDTLRTSILKEAFNEVTGLILGAGDKHNKKAFFEYIYPTIKFENIKLESGLQIFVCYQPKIILSNYYSSFRGIGLSGLKEIYHFAIQNFIF